MSEEVIIEMVDGTEEIKDCSACGNPAHCGYEINYFRVDEAGALSEEQHTCSNCQCADCIGSN